MKNNFKNLVVKNKFLIVCCAVILILSILLISAFTIEKKYVIFGENKVGYVDNVDMNNFDIVCEASYLNVKVYEKASENDSSIQVLEYNNLPMYTSKYYGSNIGINYIITRTSDVFAPEISYEAITYNNFSSQKVFESLFDLSFGIRDPSKYGGNVFSIINKSDNKVINSSVFESETSDTTYVKHVVKITINPSMSIDSTFFNMSSISFIDIDEESELNRSISL